MTDLIRVRTTVVKGVRHTTVVSRGRQGPPGPPGTSIAITRKAGATLGGHRIVRLNEISEAIYASSDTLADGVAAFGMTTGAASAGADVQIVTSGEVVEPSWSWTPNQPVYLATAGQLTQTPPAPPAAAFQLIVGLALAPTKLLVEFQEPIHF